MNVGVVGLGLIGGSMAISLREQGLHVFGNDIEPNSTEALKLNLVEQILPLPTLVQTCSFIIVATPVDVAPTIIKKLLDLCTDHHTIIDVGSTKQGIKQHLYHHHKRKQVVATHPMAGTEFSGPSAAINGLLKNKLVVLCDTELSSKEALAQTKLIYKTHLATRLVEMSSEEHDVHAAFISHLSHITSFSLSLAVLEKEKHNKNIFLLAGGGFISTVRLAKSSASTWPPILLENKQNILEAVDLYINKLTLFREALSKNDRSSLEDLIKDANNVSQKTLI